MTRVHVIRIPCCPFRQYRTCRPTHICHEGFQEPTLVDSSRHRNWQTFCLVELNAGTTIDKSTVLGSREKRVGVASLEALILLNLRVMMGDGDQKRALHMPR